MADPLSEREQVVAALELAAREARTYLSSIGDDHVRPPGSEDAITAWEDGFPAAGDGKVAFRPAIVNWRTEAEDVDLLVDVLLELSASAARTRSRRPPA
jgi:hypothetical protein